MRGRPAEEWEDRAETPLPQRGAANRRDRGPFASAGSVRSPLVEGRLLTPSQVSMEGREEVGDPVLTPPPSTRAGDAQRAPAAKQLRLLLTKARGLPERWGGTERCQLCPGSAGHLSSPRGRQSRARGPSAAVRVSANHTSKLRVAWVFTVWMMIYKVQGGPACLSGSWPQSGPVCCWCSRNLLHANRTQGQLSDHTSQAFLLRKEAGTVLPLTWDGESCLEPSCLQGSGLICSVR